MVLPDWVLKFREPKTEIKFIKGAYYKYRVDYKYNPQKKRTDKITSVLLGKITEDGFVESDKNKIRTKLISPSVDIKNFGLHHLFSTLVSDELESFKLVFPVDVCQVLFTFAMFRWGYNTPIKRVSYYFDHDFCSETGILQSITDKQVSDTLKWVGENRASVVQWMKSLLGEPASQEFVMMDSTHVFSNSELLTVNAKGYNADFDFNKQVRLMYLFSAQLQKPVYYRLVNGNVTDLTSMSLCIEEMKTGHVIYMADKGFYSKDNITMMTSQKLQYIVPLRRSNSLIDYLPLTEAGFKQKLSYFIYQGRIIWHYKYENEGQKLITFLDEGLRAKEEADYVARIKTLPEHFTEQKFIDKLERFGTLTFTYNIESKKTCEQIYQAYKQRNEIEAVFDSYKNFLKADLMHMQNRYVLEGWLTSNFIAMIAYHKLYTRLRLVKKLNKYSPKDIIEISKSIYKLKINNEWKVSKVVKKTNNLFKLINIDYLNLKS